MIFVLLLVVTAIQGLIDAADEQLNKKTHSTSLSKVREIVWFLKKMLSNIELRITNYILYRYYYILTHVNKLCMFIYRLKGKHFFSHFKSGQCHVDTAHNIRYGLRILNRFSLSLSSIKSLNQSMVLFRGCCVCLLYNLYDSSTRN